MTAKLLPFKVTFIEWAEYSVVIRAPSAHEAMLKARTLEKAGNRDGFEFETGGVDDWFAELADGEVQA